MKSILYVGATLMIGASIYGFVDYQKASRKKEFTKMYEEKNAKDPIVTDKKTVDIKSDPVVVNDKKTELTTDPVTNVTATEKPKVVKKKKVFRFSEFSRAPLDEKYLKKQLKQPETPVAEEKKTDNQ